MKTFQFVTLIALLLVAFSNAQAQTKDSQFNRAEIERGRYLIRTVGCNDCHTPQYGLKSGNVPEKDWLIGDQVGWKGPWGTTYPANIRQKISGLTEKQWITYAHTMKTRPPMPWFTLNSMNKKDLSAIYKFVRSLGPSSNETPPALPPGETPNTPYMDMTLIMPPVAAQRN